MVPRSKRFVYSLTSTAITAGICDLAICARYATVDFAHENTRSGMSALWIARLVAGIFEVLPWVLLYCIAGWILAIPITLFANVRSKFRFWMWWTAGTCIGPVVMYAVSLHFMHTGSPGQSLVWNPWFSLATGVAGLATFLYLMLLRREQERDQDLSDQSHDS